MLGASIDGAERIGTLLCADGGTSPALSTLNARVGDLAVALCMFNQTAVSGSGGTWLTDGSGTCLRWRELTSGDLSAGVTLGRGGYIAIYRGPNALALVFSNTLTGGAQYKTVGGFARSSSHLGLIAATRSLGAGLDYEVDVTAPPVFDRWGAGSYYAGSATPDNATRIAGFDRLQPLYDGESFTYGKPVSGGGTRYLHIFELRRV